MIETTILSNLVYNEEYCRKVFPYIKDDYFDDNNLKKIFSSFAEYVNDYKEPPSIEALKISVDKRKDLNEEQYRQVVKAIDELKVDEKTNIDWLTSETEQFCKDKDLYNAIRRAILIIDGQDKELDKGALPKLLEESLGISFDTHIGHDFLEDYEARHEYYNRKEERIPFDIELLNKITKGGFPKKSLNCFLAETGAGKSLVMCHMAAANLMYGKNVLYITLELSEKEVGRRIDANIMDVTLDEVGMTPLDTFTKRISRYKDKTPGKLIIKEYPTGTANAGHIRHLLNELRLKKNFTPDVIYLDYINLCSSVRIKGAAAANSYTLVKSIAEEVRGLAMEFDLPIVTATQANRGGYGNSDLDITSTSESIGLPATLDSFFALITSEELESLGQLMIKQLKNRWGDLSYYRRFVVGIDRARMKLFNLEESSQTKIHNSDPDTTDKPTFDKSSFAESYTRQEKAKNKKLFNTGDII